MLLLDVVQLVLDELDNVDDDEELLDADWVDDVVRPTVDVDRLDSD